MDRRDRSDHQIESHKGAGCAANCVSSQWLILALIGVILVVFARHLRPGALFWDEWIYVKELQASNSYLEWILSPTTGHVFIPAKLLFVTIYHFFGISLFPFRAASLALHCLIAKALYDLCRKEAGVLAAFVTAALVSLSVAYEEVIAWSAHYREQCFVLFFLLWNREVFRVRGEQDSSTSFRSLLAVVYLWLMVFSYGNIVFGLLFGVMFSLLFARLLLREGLLTSQLVSMVAILGVYLLFYKHDLAQQIAVQSSEALNISVSRLIEAFQRLGIFLLHGVFEPLFVSGLWAASTPVALLIVSLITAIGLYDCFRCRQLSLISKVGWYWLTALIITFSTVWYRSDVAFVLDWNKYSFLPIVFFAAGLSLVIRAARRSVRLCLITFVVIATVSGIFGEKRRGYDALIRHAGVMDFLSDFRELREELRLFDGNLPDISLDWPIFIKDASPSLSLLKQADPRLRSSKVRFVDVDDERGDVPNNRISPEFSRGSPKLKSFYRRYLSHPGLATEANGGVIELGGEGFLVQELNLSGEVYGWLTGLEFVIGHGDLSNRGVIEVLIHDGDFKIHSTINRQISQFTNNRPVRLESAPIKIAQAPIFISLQIQPANFERPIAVYLTNTSSAQRGKLWSCQGELRAPWLGEGCELIQGKGRAGLAIGTWQAGIPLP
jgi:hypothetical protein